jgi:hypothetical protein
MDTEIKHCQKCSPNSPCGNGHLYVLELGHGIEDRYVNQPQNGYLYVGSTGKSVEERFQDNLKRTDGTFISLNEARIMPEDGLWHYISRSTKLIRKHYVRHRPDLLYFKQNPIVLDIQRDPDRLKRRETRLANRLRNRGYKVLGDHQSD